MPETIKIKGLRKRFIVLGGIVFAVIMILTAVNLTLTIFFIKQGNVTLKSKIESLQRDESLTVTRLIVFRLTYDENLIAISDLKKRMKSLITTENPVPEEINSFIEQNESFPDGILVSIWAKKHNGKTLPIAIFSTARLHLYQSWIKEYIKKIQYDLWTQAAFSELLSGIRLISLDGSVVISSGENFPSSIATPTDLTFTPMTENSFCVTVPLYVKDDLFGTAQIVLQKKPLTMVSEEYLKANKHFFTVIVIIITTLWFFLICVWLIFIFAVRKGIISPITELANKMQNAFRTDNDHSYKIAKDMEDIEILNETYTELSNRIDTLISNLKISLKEKEEAFTALRENQLRLVQAEKMAGLSRLASGLAHEINNALNPTRIRIDSSIMNFSNGILPTAEDLQLMKKGIDSAARLLKNLRTLSKESRSPLEELPLNEAVQSAIDLFAPEIERSGIKIFCRIKEDHKAIFKNPEMVQVLLNLLGNSRDSVLMKKKEITFCGNIYIWSERADTSIKLMIADDGVGIGTEAKEHLFEPFFSKKGEKGLGLGLFVSHGIVSSWGGELTAECTYIKEGCPFDESLLEGGGAIFCIRLKTSGINP